MERGLSDNSLAAYRRDLERFARQLGSVGCVSLLDADGATLRAYLGASLQGGRAARSEARLLSCLRGFYQYALREGLIETFVDSEAAVYTPGCGVCSTSHPGILASGERCISTTNRNFQGRMGADSEVYLANPAVVAASAVLGRIGSPEEVMS